MEKFVIIGGNRLEGSVIISGAKNSALHLIPASLLVNGETVLESIPNLTDIYIMNEILRRLGAKVEYQQNGRVTIDASDIITTEATHELMRKIRASFSVMGPLLTRFGYAKVSLPGGDSIGNRPIDLHVKGFRALGAEVRIEHGFVEAKAKNLKGTKIYLDTVSVGATINIMLCATLAEGTTIIENAAKEPEIVDLANYLNAMGANIVGAGTNEIKIEGVKELKGTRYTIIPDRIETGTYMVAAAMTQGDVYIENVIGDHIRPIIAKLHEAGVEIILKNGGVRVKAKKRLNPINIKTLPHPGFPTDMQAQITAMLSIANGTSIITETIYDNRFRHVDELRRMGANIKVEGRSAIIQGVKNLTGANVYAYDLRAGMSLVLAGLVAEGTTEISDIYHIDRGYENLTGKLGNIGAQIKRVTENG